MGICQSKSEKQRISRRTITYECIGKPVPEAENYLREHFPSHKIVKLGSKYTSEQDIELSTIFVFADDDDNVIAVKMNS